MSGELRIGGPTGATIYAHIFNASSRLWNGSSFEAFSSANYPNYDISLSEQGSSGAFVGDFPSAITDEAIYEIFYYIQDGGSPAEGDPFAGSGSVDWDGSALTVSPGSVVGEMSGSDFYDYVIRTFKRTDKSTEVYDAINESIAEIRRTIRTAREETETDTTDTISVLGDYRIDVESDFGMFVSDVFIRDSSNGEYLVPISKSLFDILYSRWGTAASERDRPRNYCLFGNQILLGPVPDVTSYTYVVSYTKENYGAVSSVTTSVPFTKLDYREILKHGVLWRLYKLVENDDQAGAYKAFWDNELLQIETKEKRNRSSGFIAMQYRDI